VLASCAHGERNSRWVVEKGVDSRAEEKVDVWIADDGDCEDY